MSGDVVINGGGTTIPLDDIGDGASSYADDPPDSLEYKPPPSAPPSPPKAPVVEQGVIWISYTPSSVNTSPHILLKETLRKRSNGGLLLVRFHRRC